MYFFISKTEFYLFFWKLAWIYGNYKLLGVKTKKVTLTTKYQTEVQSLQDDSDYFDFNQLDSLCKFTDTLPVVMQQLIASKNWRIELDVNQKKFTLMIWLLYWFEKKTGYRLFEFRNFRKIKP